MGPLVLWRYCRSDCSVLTRISWRGVGEVGRRNERRIFRKGWIPADVLSEIVGEAKTAREDWEWWPGSLLSAVQGYFQGVDSKRSVWREDLMSLFFTGVAPDGTTRIVLPIWRQNRRQEKTLFWGCVWQCSDDSWSTKRSYRVDVTLHP